MTGHRQSTASQTQTANPLTARLGLAASRPQPQARGFSFVSAYPFYWFGSYFTTLSPSSAVR